MSEAQYEEAVKKIERQKLSNGKIDNIFEYFFEYDENEVKEDSKRKLKFFTFNKVFPELV